MNRILEHLSPAAVFDALRLDCERIEAAADHAIEFVVPSMDAYHMGDRAVRVFLTSDAPEAAIGDDLTAFAIEHLRERAGEMLAVANRLEQGRK